MTALSTSRAVTLIPSNGNTAHWAKNTGQYRRRNIIVPFSDFPEGEVLAAVEESQQQTENPVRNCTVSGSAKR